MIFRSKKTPEVTAHLDFEEPKYGTVTLIYLTGKDQGKSFSITKSTLKRWWKLVEDDETPQSNSDLEIDYEEVSKPYKPDVEPKYIPKPESVVRYEAKKQKLLNSDLPTFEDIENTLACKASKVNSNSKYLKFEDGTTLWRKVSKIDIYATEYMWEKFVEKGLQSTPNNDKARPFALKIETKEQYEKVLEVFGCE